MYLLNQVSKMLGHKSIKTTEIYAKILDTRVAEDMKKIRSKYSTKKDILCKELLTIRRFVSLYSGITHNPPLVELIPTLRQPLDQLHNVPKSFYPPFGIQWVGFSFCQKAVQFFMLMEPTVKFFYSVGRIQMLGMIGDLVLGDGSQGPLWTAHLAVITENGNS